MVLPCFLCAYSIRIWSCVSPINGRDRATSCPCLGTAALQLALLLKVPQEESIRCHYHTLLASPSPLSDTSPSTLLESSLKGNRKKATWNSSPLGWAPLLRIVWQCTPFGRVGFYSAWILDLPWGKSYSYRLPHPSPESVVHAFSSLTGLPRTSCERDRKDLKSLEGKTCWKTPAVFRGTPLRCPP